MVSGHATDSTAGPDITALLLAFRNPMGNVMLPRIINQNTALQAASPALEINRMLDLLGIGVETLRWMALVIILIAAVSVFISLYNSLRERRYEMALMLTMGASRGRLFGLLLLEGLTISLLGFVLGLLLGRLGLAVLSAGAERSFHYDFNALSFLPEEAYLLAGVLLVGLLAAALPSLGVYRLNLSKTLAED